MEALTQFIAVDNARALVTMARHTEVRLWCFNSIKTRIRMRVWLKEVRCWLFAGRSRWHRSCLWTRQAFPRQNGDLRWWREIRRCCARPCAKQWEWSNGETCANNWKGSWRKLVCRKRARKLWAQESLQLGHKTETGFWKKVCDARKFIRMGGTWRWAGSSLRNNFELARWWRDVLGGYWWQFYDDFGRFGQCRCLVWCHGTVRAIQEIMYAPSDDDMRTLVESSPGESLMERCRLNLVVNREPSFFPVPGLANDLTGLCVNCCLVSWVWHLGVLLLSRLPKFRSRMMLLCLWVLSQHPHHPLAFLDVDGFLWVIGEPVGYMLGRAVFCHWG